MKSNNNNDNNKQQPNEPLDKVSTAPVASIFLGCTFLSNEWMCYALYEKCRNSSNTLMLIDWLIIRSKWHQTLCNNVSILNEKCSEFTNLRWTVREHRKKPNRYYETVHAVYHRLIVRSVSEELTSLANVSLISWTNFCSDVARKIEGNFVLTYVASKHLYE